MDDNKPSYYAILSADVRYSKDIPQGAKLLFAEITALCNEKGYCWASNSYFSNLYNVSNRTISRWVDALSNSGFIELKFEYHKCGKVVKTRFIKLSTGMTKMSRGYDKNVQGGMTKMSNRILQVNNTINDRKMSFADKQAEIARQVINEIEQELEKR